MRTTVTFEPDVAKKLREVMRDQGLSMKEVVNSTLRRSFDAHECKSHTFEPKTYSMGLHSGLSLDKALAISDAIEDHAIVRKMSVRK